jgi:hypothetical protein
VLSSAPARLGPTQSGQSRPLMPPPRELLGKTRCVGMLRKHFTWSDLHVHCPISAWSCACVPYVVTGCGNRGRIRKVVVQNCAGPTTRLKCVIHQQMVSTALRAHPFGMHTPLFDSASTHLCLTAHAHTSV